MEICDAGGIKMKAEDFDKLVDARLGFCGRTLQIKAAEYATSDRLHNFKVAAALQDIEPETALLGMWAKHIVSVVDIINAIEHHSKVPEPKLLSEKITDVINYSLLLEALIEERRAEEELNKKKSFSNLSQKHHIKCSI
jgi:hypothetical protein